MNTNEPIRSEIILHEDGNFYRRDVHETVIQGAARALRESLADANYNHSIIPRGVISYSPNETDVVHKHPYFVSHNVKVEDQSTLKFHVFVHLRDGFPMPEALRIRSNTATNALGYPAYTLQPSRTYCSDRLTDLDIGTPVTAFYWNKDYTMYVCIKNLEMRNDTNGTLWNTGTQKTAYLFGIHKKTGAVATFNLPNIYDDGRICTGPDFVGDAEVRYNINMLDDYITELLKALYLAPFNNDLRGDDSDHLIVTDNGYSISREDKVKAFAARNNIPEEEVAKHPRWFNFFRPISNELLLDFAQCRISTTH